MKHALGWPTRAAATVALAAWAYSSTANTTIWRSLELINAQELNSQNSLEVEPAADDAWQCTDDNITAAPTPPTGAHSSSTSMSRGGTPSKINKT